MNREEEKEKKRYGGGRSRDLSLRRERLKAVVVLFFPNRGLSIVIAMFRKISSSGEVLSQAWFQRVISLKVVLKAINGNDE